MSLSPVALPRFLKQYKKLSPNIQSELEVQIGALLDDPHLGEKKSGDISFIRVHKFKVKKQLYLLAYSVDEGKCVLYLYSVGTHENFYRDIKKYLKP